MSTSDSTLAWTAEPAIGAAETVRALAARMVTVLVCVYIASSVGYVATESGLYVRLAQASGLSLLIALSLFPRRDDWPAYAIVFLAVLGVALRLHLQGETSAGQLLHLLAAAGAAIGFVRRPPAPWFLLLVVAGCTAFLASRIAAGAFPETVLLRRSGNHISVLMLAPAFLCTIEEARRGGRLSLLPPILAALACTWALGRAGIAVSYAYLGFVLWHGRGKFGRFTPWLALAATTAFVVPMLMRNWWLVELWFGALFAKFRTKSVTEDPRFHVLADYVTTLDPAALLLGQDPVFVTHAGLSLHNSFLQWHFNFGAAAFVIAGITAAALVRAVRLRRMVVAVALSLLLARSFSDTVLLAGLFDLPFLVCLLLAFRAASPDEATKTGAYA